MSFSTPADRIRAMIDNARSLAAGSGRDLDMNGVYLRALVRCGIGRAEAARLLAEPGHDPIARILHFAGDSHNFAVLAVEEALEAA